MKAAETAMKNYEAYMRLDLTPFEGLWIAVFNDRVVSSGADAKRVYEEAMKTSRNKPVLLTKVPRRGIIEIL